MSLLSSHVIELLICHYLGLPDLVVTLMPVLLGFLEDLFFLDAEIADKLSDLHLLFAFDYCHLVKVSMPVLLKLLNLASKLCL